MTSGPRIMAYSLERTVYSDSLSSIICGLGRDEEAPSSEWEWIDVCKPTAADFTLLSSRFDFHPLSIETVLETDDRDKFERFSRYFVVTLRSVDLTDRFLEPIHFYIFVFDNCVLSFHSHPVPHIQSILDRMQLLVSYGSLISSDWLAYALIDDIVDSFLPLLQRVEQEVFELDRIILKLTGKSEQVPGMLKTIGVARKRVSGLFRLLYTKTDVLKAMIKRYHTRLTKFRSDVDSYVRDGRKTKPEDRSRGWDHGGKSMESSVISWASDESGDSQDPLAQPSNSAFTHESDTILYLCDIQDHIITMIQTINHCDAILTRAHSNYLAQINIEITQAAHRTNSQVLKLTSLGSLLIPLNLVTGFMGMNVNIPGKEGPYFAIVVALLICLFSVVWMLTRRLFKQL
ncbi:hypothetical protein BC830DRAFT_1136027 [Chytriomyces sp. MP71]|nr:hypothetical protein BC830DRAFT_1136027 [Chytriomyces sp. MP71]